ncbi:MAG TPA: hypothetical protein PKN93_18565 [Leptospiraceae bacterium]|mgnify:CR=1 FL=1|nr:hypothetical protein [Leptospiraceae bacterium]
MKNWVIVSLAGGIISALAVSLGSFGTYPSDSLAFGMLVLGLSIGASFAALHYLRSAKLWIAVGGLILGALLCLAFYVYRSINVVYARGIGIVVWTTDPYRQMILFPGEKCRQ